MAEGKGPPIGRPVSASAAKPDDLKVTSGPLPEFGHVKWLQIHRQQLVAALQATVEAVVDSLVGNGHLDPVHSEACQEILSERTVPVNKVRKLLDWLVTQSETVFWGFQHALNDSGCGSLTINDEEVRRITELLEAMPLADKVALRCGRGVRKARDKLQTFYRSRSKIAMAPGIVAGGKRMELDDIFVNLCILSADDMEKLLKESSFSSLGDQHRSEHVFAQALNCAGNGVELNDIFERNEGEGDPNPEQVLAAGGAGSGKTVCFTRKVPCDWARGRLWQQFVLMFCLELRNKQVWTAQTPAELFKLVQLGLSGDECGEVMEFVQNHPEQVVVVCDGLDEGHIVEDSLLWQMLQGNCVGIPANIRFVLTSRPCAELSLLSKTCIDQRVEVVGFTDNDVSKFVVRYLGEVAGKKLLGQLKRQPSIAALMHAPFFSLLICEQFKEHQLLPDRKTDIFSQLLIRLLQRQASQNGQRSIFKSLEEAPDNVKELVMSLARIAYQGLKEKKLCFTNTELSQARFPMEAVQLGLLVEAEGSETWDDDCYSFSHLTVQEFLTALYVTYFREVIGRSSDFSQLARDMDVFSGHVSTFVVFVAGLLQGDDVHSFLKFIKQQLHPGEVFPLKGRLLLYQCFYECSLGKSLLKSPAINAHLMEKSVSFSMFTGPLAVSDCIAVATVLQCHPHVVTVVSIYWCKIGDLGLAELLPGLKCCTHLKRLDLSLNNCSGKHMKDLNTVVSTNAMSLRLVYVGGNPIGDAGFAELVPGLQRCHNLKKLELINCRLTSISCDGICTICTLAPSLEKLSIRSNSIKDSGLKKLSSGLQCCKRLTFLDLSNCGLSSSSLPTIKILLNFLISLMELKLSSNNFCEDVNGENTAALCHVIHRHPTLLEVFLANCQFPDICRSMLWNTQTAGEQFLMIAR